VKRTLLALALAPLCFGGLTNPLVSNTLTAPADWSFFFANGSMTETADGLTSGTNGSLIYGVSLPSNYEVRSRYKLTNNGGSYVTYVRASSDANLHTVPGLSMPSRSQM
jgi:hypothetical protein